MLFVEPEFLFFFLPVTLALVWLAPRSLRNGILLIASLLFYTAGEGFYVLIMLGSIVFNHAVALGIDAADSNRRRKFLVGVAVLGNLLLLVRFKYTGFLLENLNDLLAATDFQIPMPHLHLPIGISFFTFQAMSYVIDVYRRELRAMRNPLDFALYISLFPQLIAGPIVRARTVADAIRDRRIRLEDVSAGAQRFVTGLGKKLIIADTVALGADAAFGAAGDQLTPALAWTGLLCYSLQIYFDFSGYSDMAIGMGRMLGFRFLENFRYPYFAQSMNEFWRRWHISLSTWFRDYLYIPLGGSRVSRARVYFNLLVVFVLCGIWHGASWMFVAWGLWHGAFLVVERAGFGAWLHDRNRWIRHLYALAGISLGWVFFRATTIGGAAMYFAALVGFGGTKLRTNPEFGADLWLAIVFGIVLSTPVVKWIKAWWVRQSRAPGGVGELMDLVGTLTGVVVMTVILLTASALVAAGTHNPFIYFRF